MFVLTVFVIENVQLYKVVSHCHDSHHIPMVVSVRVFTWSSLLFITFIFVCIIIESLILHPISMTTTVISSLSLFLSLLSQFVIVAAEVVMTPTYWARIKTPSRAYPDQGCGNCKSSESTRELTRPPNRAHKFLEPAQKSHMYSQHLPDTRAITSALDLIQKCMFSVVCSHMCKATLFSATLHALPFTRDPWINGDNNSLQCGLYETILQAFSVNLHSGT